MVILWVLEIGGVCPGVPCLLNGYAGEGPVIHQYLLVVDAGVDAPVTGNDAGGLPLSALSNCSSLDVVVSCLSGSGSESELSVNSPMT